MIQQITHIRIKNAEKFETESIIDVLLASGEMRSITTLINYLSIGEKYYYFSSSQRVTYVEAVHPLYKNAYIRSSDFDGVWDNLMNLPRF